jgi:hypothetical protein
MSFDLLHQPIGGVDESLTSRFDTAPFEVALGLAVLLGLRHASDPDHLVAVTSLVASSGSDARPAARLGAWWGAGHALTLLLIGLPLIAVKGSLPAWFENGAESAVGVVIVLLAGRVLWKWERGYYRAAPHRHERGEHRHLQAGSDHTHHGTRRPGQAFAVGVLHGLAGTGAIVLLMVAALPSSGEAMAALAIFAPMSIVSMAAFTASFAWALTRPAVEPIYVTLGLPLLGSFGLLFGLWHSGLVV